MNEAELTVRIIAASGPSTVDDLTTFLRKRIDEDRSTLDTVAEPSYVRSQPLGIADLTAMAGGTTVMVPLGRFHAHLDAIASTLDKYEAALGQLARAKEMGWEYQSTQVAMVAYMDVIKGHALEYANHPGYKTNWRP